ncbi:MULTISPECIES: hypothetical protein [Enterobacter cloacae complex]|uniref:hypothetical protein n=1 Tax=Enterobacter cloacae complex TaxID=354276 RepID=UPI00064B0C0A|nr:hypothetical protein [Enterobacter hormaechei]EJK6494460.1 hypothetical protein [Escherichia coli]EJB8197293.1 hypothetical protein [Enterobacter hormaechei]EKH4174699.1 hypothetical protein [Escherichia coli]EKU5343592.1 hypothetical protein [Enterobacter hormaechei]EKU5348426.1 hypothetical protein [Enterobacter hormaechei]
MKFEDGKIIFDDNDKDFLRGMKHSIADPKKTISTRGKCPYCSNTLEYYEVFTSDLPMPERHTIIPAFDEKGVMIGKCENCNNTFKVEITNPDLSNFTPERIKEDFYFLSDTNQQKTKKYSNIKTIESFVETNTILTDRHRGYDFNDNPLFICKDCHSNLENISYTILKDQKWNALSNNYSNYINWDLASHGSSPKYIVIRFPFYCSCGKKHDAVFYSDYHETSDFQQHQFSLLNIFGAQPLSETLFGVYTKTTIMTWLYKLLTRWDFLYDEVYIISPFVGHQFLNNTDLVNTWLNVLSRVNPQKTKIFVRNGQSKSFKRAFSETNIISYDDMEKFDLGSVLIDELKSKNNFHAKVYCAVSQNRCEILNGSMNLVEGKSFEVANFDILDSYSKAFDKFLNPLGIKRTDKIPPENNKKEFSLLFDEKSDFNPYTGTLYPESYISVAINNQDPTPRHP